MSQPSSGLKYNQSKKPALLLSFFADLLLGLLCNREEEGDMLLRNVG
jgi:hypothetical protein